MGGRDRLEVISEGRVECRRMEIRDIASMESVTVS